MFSEQRGSEEEAKDALSMNVLPLRCLPSSPVHADACIPLVTVGTWLRLAMTRGGFSALNKSSVLLLRTRRWTLRWQPAFCVYWTPDKYLCCLGCDLCSTPLRSARRSACSWHLGRVHPTSVGQSSPMSSLSHWGAVVLAHSRWLVNVGLDSPYIHVILHNSFLSLCSSKF